MPQSLPNGYIQTEISFVSPDAVRALNAATAIVANKLYYIAQRETAPFHVPYRKICSDTGLSKNQVQYAFQKLRDRGIITTTWKGLPARLWTTFSCSRYEMLLLQKKKIIPCLKHTVKTYGASRAILISQLRYWYEKMLQKEFWKTHRQLSEETGLSISQIQYHLRILRERQAVSVRIGGVPKRTYITAIEKMMNIESKFLDERIVEIVKDFNLVTGKGIVNLPDWLLLRLSQLLNQDGFTLDDFKAVHRLKYGEWKDESSMRKYIRPRTFWGEKFSEYVDEAKTTAKENNTDFAAAKELFLKAQKCRSKNPGCSANSQRNNPSHQCFFCSRHRSGELKEIIAETKKIILQSPPSCNIAKTESSDVHDSTWLSASGMTSLDWEEINKMKKEKGL